MTLRRTGAPRWKVISLVRQRKATQVALAAWRFARDAPLMRSVRHLWAEPVRPRRALEKAEFDQYPDRADDSLS